MNTYTYRQRNDYQRYQDSCNQYLFSGDSGFVTNDLQQLLLRNNIKPYGNGTLSLGTQRKLIPSYVRFLYVEYNIACMGYDKNTYSIKADVMNILETHSKHNLVRKSALHQSLSCSSFISKTLSFEDFKYTGGIYIFRPCGLSFCGGKDIIIVSSHDEYITAHTFYTSLINSRNRPNRRNVNVIVSEYITSPMLFEGRKFHLRLYLLVVSPFVNVPFKCKIARHFGEIFTASKLYVNGDFSNKDIHDTHCDSTPRSLYFPADFPDQTQLPSLNHQLDILELELSAITKDITPFTEQCKAAYEVFALDILVLNDTTIKLLEVNDKVGYWPKNKLEESTVNFVRDHSLWQWNEAILPLLNATKY